MPAPIQTSFRVLYQLKAFRNPLSLHPEDLAFFALGKHEFSPFFG
jgi:hypothetical protein